jgi:hypothetical protein
MAGRKLIQDEFTPLAKKFSRQYLWQLRKVKEGRCINCGKGDLATKLHCGLCAKNKSIHTRKRSLELGITKRPYKPIEVYEPYGRRKE